MSNVATKKLMACLAVLVAVLMTFALFSVVGTEASAQPEADNVLYSEDFSQQLPSEWADVFTVSDGAATVATSDPFTLPLESMAASNNYEVSFDIKLTGTSEFYVHFKGLDGTHNDDIYLCIIAQGQFLRVTNNYGQDVYNNSGDLHGGLDATPADLTTFASFKFVHFEGYVELWVNGTRRAVSHLSNFGNNNYQTRATLEEGTISEIYMRAQNANAVVLDNIKVTEAQGKVIEYSETNTSTETNSLKTFDLSGQNLYLDNFMVEGTFRVADTSKTGYYPTIKLFGLNGSLVSNNQKEYAVNVQTFVDGANFTPQLCWQPEDPSTAWRDIGGNVVTMEQGQDITYRIEVYGDNIEIYINGQLSIDTTFTEMGMTRGHLQYIRIVSGYGGTYWTNFSYKGYETDTGVDIKASSTLVKVGEQVTFDASIFGIKDGEYQWYVNGEAQGVTDRQFTFDAAQKGSYTVQYKSETVESNEITVVVEDKLINISAETTEIYPTESVVITATLDGDFEGDILKWYVNGEEQEETSTTLTLSGLPAGEYIVTYKTDTVSSNELKITVLESEIEVTTEKNSYFANETATFNAELIGMDGETALKWYVDGTEQTSSTSTQLQLDLTQYEPGTSITVYCETANGIKSNEVVISVVYDVLDGISSNEFYKEIFKVEIDDSKTYGNFSVGEDANGKYLYSTVENNSTYYVLEAKMPTNVAYAFEYKLFVPEDINGIYYVYPTLTGVNSKYPQGQVEFAWEVNGEGFRPYIKDQSTGKVYEEKDYGFGKDLTYEGVAKKGDWNQVSVAIHGNYVAMYLNGEIVLFFEMVGATVPSAGGFNLYPDGGKGVVPLRIKDITFSSIVEPAPDLQSVSLSVSSIKVGVNQSVTATATLTPFNAEANSISWFVNNEKVDGNTLTMTFTFDKAGEYTIHCEIDGIKSSAKTITVTADNGGGEGGGGNNSTLWIIIGVVAAVVVIGAVVTVIVIRKKKNS